MDEANVNRIQGENILKKTQTSSMCMSSYVGYLHKKRRLLYVMTGHDLNAKEALENS